MEDKDISGTIGIAHTRWATHGEPNDVNAHPHYSENGSIALIHNGIIENYGVLKAMLAEKGYTFRSETDTEVLVQFIEYLHTENRCTLFEAVQAALNQVIGAYAIAVLDRTNNDEIIAARKSSPLVVGIGEGEYFLASDATPIVEYVKDVVYLNDGEIAVINRHKPLKVVNLNNIESKIDIRKPGDEHLGASKRAVTRTSCSRKSSNSRVPLPTASGAASTWRARTWCCRASSTTRSGSSMPGESSSWRAVRRGTRASSANTSSKTSAASR